MSATATTIPDATRGAPPSSARGADARAGSAELRPRLAEGAELVGRFEDSGFKDPPYIARRADGQVVQLPQLLYRLAEQCDGRRDCATIAARVSEAVGRGLSGDDVRFLVERKLCPLGVLTPPDGARVKLRKVDPLLALRFRAAIVPQRAVRAITTLFLPLFWPSVIAATAVGLAALDAWLFLVHGVAAPIRQLLYQPLLIVMVFGLVALSAAFHEFGHATACRYGGAKPGRMGVGIYLVWPAFYTDVTDAYRLGRWGRLRTDLGGVYFNGIFALLTAAGYFATGFGPLLIVVAIQHLQMLHQLLPLLRLDGYYVISDLTGVPDMLSRIRPVLRSLVPGRGWDPRVEELKPWVRVVTTTYLLLLVPALALVFALIAISAPRVVATAWDSLLLRHEAVTTALHQGSMLGAVAGSLQMLTLALPPAGLGLTSARVGKRLGLAAWRGTEDAPALRAALATVVAAAVVAFAYVSWPNGDYKPIQPGERGTLQAGLEALADIPTGRPSLTAEHERAVGGAPTLRAQPAGAGGAPGDGARAGGEPGGGAPGGVPEDGDDQRERERPRGDERQGRAPGHDKSIAGDGSEQGQAEQGPTADGTPSSDANDAPVPTGTTRTSESTSGQEEHQPSDPPATDANGPGPGSRGDNLAVALNTRDGTSIFRLAFAVRRVMNGVVDQINAAVAYASCERCSATAIAIQVVLVGTRAATITPTNLAVAINERCTVCTTAAFAYQYMLGTDGPARFTPEGNRRVAGIRRRLRALRHAQLSVPELDARVSALTDELQTVLREELVSAGVPDGRREQADEPPPEETPAREASPDGTQPAPGESEPPPEDTSTEPGACTEPDDTATEPGDTSTEPGHACPEPDDGAPERDDGAAEPDQTTTTPDGEPTETSP